MAIDGFGEILTAVYIAKRLHEIGKYDVAEASFPYGLDYDSYYNGMYSLIDNLFEYSRQHYYESRVSELIVVSDPIITEFYILAGEYGKQKGISDNENPYIQDAKDVAGEYLGLCSCVSWAVLGHTKPKREYHSRIGVMVCQECSVVDIGSIAVGLVEVYTWFEDNCEELRYKVYNLKPYDQVSIANMWEGVTAA
jgi:hypothetical protein